jgi:preprotein translocase subunit SecA
MKALYEPTISSASFSNPETLTSDEIIDAYVTDADAAYAAREAQFGDTVMRQLERTVTLSVIDNKWREHLAEMDYLRSGIGLRAMGQKDPLVEYQREGFNYFEELIDAVKYDATRYMFHVDVVQQQEAPKAQVTTSSAKSVQQLKQKQFIRTGEKVGRNAPCPCGSGKKYKRCHGAVGAEPLV